MYASTLGPRMRTRMWGKVCVKSAPPLPPLLPMAWRVRGEMPKKMREGGGGRSELLEVSRSPLVNRAKRGKYWGRGGEAPLVFFAKRIVGRSPLVCMGRSPPCMHFFFSREAPLVLSRSATSSLVHCVALLSICLAKRHSFSREAPLVHSVTSLRVTLVAHAGDLQGVTCTGCIYIRKIVAK
jgi:hypothetical protein